MNALIESLNLWGTRFFGFALPLLWQSSLLIAVVFGVDFLLRRKIRPAVRYTLWLVVFIKLLVPPTLALPTSAAWWLRTRKAQVIAPHIRTMTVSYSEPDAAFVPPSRPVVPLTPPRAKLSREAWIVLVSISVSALLAAWLVFRWRQIARCVRKTTAATGEIQEMLAEVRCRAGLRKIIRLRLTAESMSPAVCGLFRPVVLLPQSLIERLTPDQLRAVLLHELIHLRRRDVWVNCAQTLLQIVYWWHPLLWFANARVRQVREEAVDDAVMFALNEQAEIYAPTLLEVAKLAFNRPLATLGLVGILESRNALRQRIERLLNFTTPRRVGVSVMSVIGIVAFTALAVPMGEPPARSSQTDEIFDASDLINFHAKVNPEVFIRNLKARASETMHTTNDDWNDILVSVLDGLGVDCTPPRNITFDAATGEITTKNSSEALGILDEVVKELSLAGGERILNPPYGLKQVLIEAQFYRMRPADFAKLNLDSGASHHDRDLSPWWGLSPEQLTDVRQRIKAIGVESMASPRVQTSHGITAGLSIGDGTNNIKLECVPFIHDGFVKLTALARTTGKYAPNGKGWPDFAGHTNCAIFSRVGIADGGGVVLRAEHAGTMPENELIVLLKAKIVEQPAPHSNAGIVKANVTIETNHTPRFTPNPYASTNIIRTSAARQKIYEKLNDIKFDKVSYPGLALTEVIRNLRTETKQRDPDQEGINFVLNRAKPPAVGATGQPPTFDPATGRPIATAQLEDVDLGTVTISLDPGLQNVRLMDVLEAIVKTSDHPIKYSLLDYGIEFSFKGPDVPELHTRTFKVDPNMFYQGLQNVGTLKPASQSTGSGGQTPQASVASTPRGVRYVAGLDPTTEIQLAVISFFNAIGVNLSAPKSVFFNDRQGTLTVHATDVDLDLIEQAINTLNIKPPEVTVKVRFVEVDADNKNLNSLLGGILTNAPSTSTNSPTLCGILSEPRLRSVLKALEKRDHADLLNEGEVTTLSGRRANFQVVDIKTIVTGFSTTTNSSIPEVNTAITTNGTTVDVVSYVCADGYTIQMTATPAVTEFLGYADSGKSSKIVQTFKYPHQLFPASRVRTATISAIVSDGQTLVLGSLSDELVVNELDGKELRRPFTNTKKKQLFVFITATIIDAAGNRVHSDDVHSKDYYDGPVF